MNHTKVGPFAAILTAALLGSSEAIAARPTTVPLSIVHNYPILSADINGHEVRLLFDLGYDASLGVTRATLDEIGIEPSGPIHSEKDEKGHATKSRSFEVPSIHIGSEVFAHVTARVDTSPPARFGQQGYIGPSLFSSYRVVLDYRHGKMTLIPRGTGRIERAGCTGVAVPSGDGVVKARTDLGDLTLVWDTGAPVTFIRKARIDQAHVKIVNHVV